MCFIIHMLIITILLIYNTLWRKYDYSGRKSKKKFFANLLGISVAKLSAMLQGKRKMKADELIIFSEYFNLKSDFFADVNCLQECN